MRSLKEISDRQIIKIAIIGWALVGLFSIFTENLTVAASAGLAIALGFYGLRLMRKREKS
jgi:hypothetical protein